jgi:hypothetical protein
MSSMNHVTRPVCVAVLLSVRSGPFQHVQSATEPPLRAKGGRADQGKQYKRYRLK